MVALERMYALERKPLNLIELVGRARGGSLPILAKADDGNYYFAKFANNPQGPNVLFNEAVGTELYRAFGLPVPDWRPLLITRSFISRNRILFFNSKTMESRPPEPGLCFGSLSLGRGADLPLEALSGSEIGRVENRADFGLAWLLDICARHCDDRQAVFVETPNRRLRGIFIDHGHMFGGPDGTSNPYVVHPRYSDRRIYEETPVPEVPYDLVLRNLDAVWRCACRLPLDWQTDSALRSLATSFDRMGDKTFLKMAKEAISDCLTGKAGDRIIERGPEGWSTRQEKCIENLYRWRQRPTELRRKPVQAARVLGRFAVNL